MPRGKKITITCVRGSDAIMMPCGVVLEVSSRQTEMLKRYHMRVCKECPLGSVPIVIESRTAGSVRRVSAEETGNYEFERQNRARVEQKMYNAIVCTPCTCVSVDPALESDRVD